MVALFVSLKVLRADPMNVHVGSNKSGDWYYMVQNSLGTAAWGDFMCIDHTRIP